MQSTLTGVTTTHEERLTVPWRWWLGALAVTAGLAAPFGGGTLGPAGWAVVFVGLAGAAGAGLWWLGRLRVAVIRDPLQGDTLQVDDARLPVRFIADVVPLDPEGRRELLGPGADPLAFVVQRPWISGAAQIVLDDPADPTPYWLISTRHPERLATALDRAALRSGSDRGAARREDRRGADRPATG